MVTVYIPSSIKKQVVRVKNNKDGLIFENLDSETQKKMGKVVLSEKEKELIKSDFMNNSMESGTFASGIFLKNKTSMEKSKNDNFEKFESMDELYSTLHNSKSPLKYVFVVTNEEIALQKKSSTFPRKHFQNFKSKISAKS